MNEAALGQFFAGPGNYFFQKLFCLAKLLLLEILQRLFVGLQLRLNSGSTKLIGGVFAGAFLTGFFFNSLERCALPARTRADRRFAGF